MISDSLGKEFVAHFSNWKTKYYLPPLPLFYIYMVFIMGKVSKYLMHRNFIFNVLFLLLKVFPNFYDYEKRLSERVMKKIDCLSRIEIMFYHFFNLGTLTVLLFLIVLNYLKTFCFLPFFFSILMIVLIFYYFCKSGWLSYHYPFFFPLFTRFPSPLVRTFFFWWSIKDSRLRNKFFPLF